MIETIVIGLLFIAAIGYLLWQVKKQFSRQEAGCAKGCGGACSSIDFQKMEAEISRKEKALSQ